LDAEVNAFADDAAIEDDKAAMLEEDAAATDDAARAADADEAAIEEAALEADLAIERLILSAAADEEIWNA
jgi:hypothetical protein